MPIWQIGPVADAPTVSLLEWRILKTNDGTRHFVGSDNRDMTGRVSSAITLFDGTLLRGETQSGRVYQLLGVAGYSSNGDYVWHNWCKVNDVKSYTDVTQLLLAGVSDDSPE
ncbi:hypothetical protein [Paraburkholderia tropica]|uniref:hypothetical protein n=1 Tax=Paraburkholderia tropica TaxID=92647 RepID=UPI0007EE1388|nr:hypothetical protein [Paraburkholderia tropica]OBR53158.1 hypothetical protein A6456_09350 [Paraburkholderia tropica]